MATNKQCGMLTAKAKIVGMPLEWDTCKKMENGEVDDMLAKIAAYKKPNAAAKPAQQTQQKVGVDGNNFGMALKSVFHFMNDHNAGLPDDKAVEMVLDRYDMAQKAKEAVNSASSSSSTMDRLGKAIKAGPIHESIEAM